ncbi:phytoene dehydrogenase [Rhizocola hellebori]|uniref:Phytoene dehydrogenase n=1 Tax=Rhizocola hellebori TaxID=1392758 RepID=A0A8J3QI27_9ACTN|nr:phytoene dehydrogenase [Rhizocola hellebori]
MVGAGLSGLACAIYLTASGREVTLLDRRTSVGGRHSALDIDGYRFDTGPVTPLSPAQIAAPFHAAGERLQDWLELLPLDTVCRAHYPDGTTLDVSTDHHRTAAAIRALCGGSEARAFMRYLKARPLRVPGEVFFNNARTQRLFGSSSFFGFNVLGMGWHPRGGTEAIPRALGSLAEKLGVNIRMNTAMRRWEINSGRAVALHTNEDERLTADAFVFPPEGTPKANGPSHLVIHLGTSASYTRIAHHNVHFGKAWQRSKHEISRRGELMSDPTVLVSAPGVTDGSAGQGHYRVVVPVPNLRSAPLDWQGPATRTYAGEIVATLEARGYLDLGVGLTTSYVVTPGDWAKQGLPYGIPRSPSGRATRIHPSLSNVVIAGSGLSAGRTAAEKVVAL